MGGMAAPTAPKDFHEIYDQVIALEADFVTFRGEDEQRVDLYTMRRSVDLIEDIARDGQVDILSPDLIYEASKIRADLLAMPVEFTCYPTGRDERGGIKHRDQVRADLIERATAVWWGQQNRGKRLDTSVIWRQLIDRLAIVILECKENAPPDQKRGQSDREYEIDLDSWQQTKNLWRTFEVEPRTCAWEEKEDIPTLLVRRYKQLAWKTMRDYRGRGPKGPGAQLSLEDGKWDWVSDEYVVYETRNAAGGGSQAVGANRLRELEMVWMDDGEWIYICALNDDGKSGLVVYAAPNPVGRVSGVLVPGNKVPLRRPEDRYEPFLWPLMMDTEQLNVIESMRATAAKNVTGANEYVALDPEVAKHIMINGKDLPAPHEWQPGETPYLPGELKTRATPLSEDWDKLEERIEARAARHRLAPVVAEDPDAAKAGTAAGLLANLESHMRQLNPLVTNWDLAKVQLAEMFHYSIRKGIYADAKGSDYGQFRFPATGKERAHGKTLKAGEVYTLDASTFDFPYEFEAESKQHTEAQAAARYAGKLAQYILPDGKRGPASFADLMDAADYTDQAAQLEVLAKEAILDRLDPWLDEQAQTAASTQIEIDSGIRVPLPLAQNAQPPAAPAPGAPGTPPAGAPPLSPGPAPTAKPPANLNVGTRFSAPGFEGPTGGTSGVK